MPDMNNHTIEGLRAQRDALLTLIQKFYTWSTTSDGDTIDWIEKESGALIATIEGLPQESPRPITGDAWQGFKHPIFCPTCGNAHDSNYLCPGPGDD